MPAAFTCASTVASAPHSRADVAAYLVNVTARRGHNFANADDALAYGHGSCDKIAQGRTCAQIMGDVKADFQTADQYQASYVDRPVGHRIMARMIQPPRRAGPHWRWLRRWSPGDVRPRRPPLLGLPERDSA
jgi:hypothetical protein